MKVNYFEIIKQSWKITWQNKYLWWFGLFLSISSLGSFNYSFNENRGSWEKAGIDGQKMLEFFQHNLSWIIPTAIAFIVLYLILVILGVISRGGLIKSIDKISQEEKISFKEGFREGKRYFWQILFLHLLIGFSVLLVTLLVTVPVVFLFMQKAYVVGALIALMAILIVLPLYILSFFLTNFGSIYIVLGKLKVLASIESAYRLLRKNLASSLVMGLALWPIGFLAILATIFALIPLVIIFLILGLALFLFLAQLGAIIALILGALTFIIISFFIGSIYQVFSQAVWVLFFKEIAKANPEETIEEIEKEASGVPSPNPIP